MVKVKALARALAQWEFYSFHGQLGYTALFMLVYLPRGAAMTAMSPIRNVFDSTGSKNLS